MPTYDVTITFTIKADDQETAMARVASNIIGQRKHPFEDVHFDQVKEVK